MLKVIIVGGVAGGASAAARLRRLDEECEIVMFERGEDISYANCGLPYYVGGVIKKRQSLLVQTPMAMRRRFNVDVRTLSEVTRIFPEQKEVEVFDCQKGQTYRESYDYLILSPGAAPVKPNLPGIDMPNVFVVRNIPDSDRIKAWVELKKPGSAVVVGAGFIGLEMAENLKERGVEVAIVEMAPQVLSPLDGEMAAIVQRYLREKGISLFLQDGVVALEGREAVEKVILNSGREISCGLVILGIGVKPEVRLAQEAGLALGSTGGILVDEYLRTSDPYIYAVGDAIQVKSYIGGHEALIPLAGPANKQGRIAADNIAGRKTKYEGTLGTAIAKIFDMVVASTGINEKTAKRLGIEYEVSYTHPAAHATYYPNAPSMSMKIIFEKERGRLLGAQIVGYQGVDKRIDVLATCIRKDLTVFDLMELELAYAPPFSSAKDPVNMAGYVAANILEGQVEIVHWHQIEELKAKGALLLDVRTPEEFQKGNIEGSINIPVDDLRSRLQELPQDRPIVIYCRVGLRGYIACRILKQKGFSWVRNLSGGYLTYEPAKAEGLVP